MVVLDSNVLVYTLVSDCLAVVAYLVGMVGMDLVVLPMGFLGFLVGNYIQRSYDLALAKKWRSSPVKFAPKPWDFCKKNSNQFLKEIIKLKSMNYFYSIL